MQVSPFLTFARKQLVKPHTNEKKGAEGRVDSIRFQARGLGTRDESQKREIERVQVGCWNVISRGISKKKRARAEGGVYLTGRMNQCFLSR